MYSTEGTQVGPAPGARPLTGITMHLTPAIAILVPRPFVHAVTDGRMTRMTAPIALPLVGVQLGATGRHVVGNEATARPCVGVITDPKAMFARLPRHHTDDGWAIIGVGPMALAPLRTPSWWVSGITMGRAFFPRRSGTVHQPQRPCQPSSRWEPSHSDWPGGAVVGYASVCVIALTHAPSEPSTRPGRCHVGGVPVWPVVAGFLRRPFLSAGYSSHGTPDSGRPENAPVRGIDAALCSDSADIAGRAGAGSAPTTMCKYYRLVAQ
jgi:hypothetical protein